jgi:hypothetical protein
VRTGGILLSLVGGVLLVIGFIWGWVVGFYPSDLPAIVVLLLLGAGGLWGGTKLIADAPDDPATPAAPVASTHWLAASSSASSSASSASTSVRTSEPSDTAGSEIGSDTSAERLAELAAANPRLWPQIELHPNVYPALTEWINAERQSRRREQNDRPEETGRPEQSDQPEQMDAARRASDPTTRPGELAALAGRHPELRAAIAANPAAYPALREWIAQNAPE